MLVNCPADSSADTDAPVVDAAVDMTGSTASAQSQSSGRRSHSGDCDHAQQHLDVQAGFPCAGRVSLSKISGP